MTLIRCAIYTRKSSEEGLEQGFNTLYAQHEACAAYIASQKHEGWTLLKERFDDGGWSGGNTDRPGLQRLLAEIDAGRIDMIVVYKIDRLTRALADFARLVERLDAKGCSFVSVTQAFNTSTSMGRLTLNVLLSFAQFEREVTGERIRDKIAASRKRGLWMGGTLPLGYDRHPDPHAQVLVVNDAEAGIVRQIFDLYEQARCLRQLTVEVTRLGLRSKSRKGRDGGEIGDCPLGRGQLHYLLTNPVYRGRIRHRGAAHEGQHPAIIDAEQWDRVQHLLQSRAGRARGDGGATAPEQAALTGKLCDETGDRLTPTHSVKGARRYRYYVSNRLISGPPDPTGWRIPAAALEAGVADGIAGHLRRMLDEHRLLRAPDLALQQKLAHRLGGVISRGTAAGASAMQHQRRILDLLEHGTVARDEIRLTLSRDALAALCDIPVDDIAEAVIHPVLRASLRRRGVEARLIIGARQRQPDPRLTASLGRAHRWLRDLRTGHDITSLAQTAGISEGCLRVHLQLAFLAPTIQQAILTGTQPEHLTLHRLTRPEMPADWPAQYRRTGIYPD